MRRHRRSSVVLAALFSIFFSLPLPAYGEPLQDVLTLLIKNHPQLSAARKRIDAAEEGTNKAIASFLPTVTVNGDIGPESVDNPAERANDGEPFTRLRSTAGLTVKQNIFDGFHRLSSYSSAEISKRASETAFDNSMQNILYEGVAAYIDVLRQNRLVQLARDNEKNIEQQLELEDERVQRGSGITVDVLQAKSRLQLAKERLVTFEGELQNATARYTQVFGFPPDIEAMKEPSPPIDLIPDDLDTAVSIAVDDNPSISNGDLLIENAREKRRLVRSEYFPVVDLVGAANYEKDRNATRGTRRDYSVLLQAQWNLFSGLSTSADSRQAAHEFSASQDNLAHVMRKITEQTKIAWQIMITTQQRVDLLENAVNIAAEVFEARKKLREAGKETVINVLDAENEIYNAKINYTAASYDS
ncbi:MAG: TolC family outer membrane protein, partial [Rhodospirillales bacterium]|nr:TolC family outer membrane protein [Rhodospirillales bacterium]